MACEDKRWEAAMGLLKALKAHLVPDLVSPLEETLLLSCCRMPQHVAA